MGERATAVQRARETTPAKAVESERGLFDRMNQTFDAIAKRAFEIFEGNGRVFGRDLDDWFAAERELLHPVSVDIAETEKSLHVKAEVPGFTEKELEVSVEPERITIAGHRETTAEEKKGKAVYSEVRSNKIFRQVRLPAAVDPEKVEATLKNGVLDLTMPKAASAPVVRVQPKVA